MNQQPAKISSELLEQLINREFCELSNEVTEKLKNLNSDSEAGRRRIAAAILKLANGELNELNQLIKQANSDYRDVIAWAEYPRVFKAGFGELTDEEELQANKADWKEYQNWLNGNNL